MDPKRREGLSNVDISRLAAEDAKKVFKETCIDPFEEAVDKDVVPYIHVSSLSSFFCSLYHTSNIPAARPGHEETLRNLIRLTYDNVYRYIRPASGVLKLAVAHNLTGPSMSHGVNA